MATLLAAVADRVFFVGSLFADGGGQVSLNAGYGAGGGILLQARQGLVLGNDTVISSLGGICSDPGVRSCHGALCAI